MEDGSFLLLSDVPEDTIYRWSAEGGVEPWIRPSGLTLGGPRSREPGANGLVIDDEGRLVLCQHGDRRVARLKLPPKDGPWIAGDEIDGDEDDGNNDDQAAPFETLADTYDGQRFHSPNDLVIHPSGDGRHLGTLRIDAPTANCTFGDDGRSLFVTSNDRLLRIRLHTVGLGFPAP